MIAEQLSWRGLTHRDMRQQYAPHHVVTALNMDSGRAGVACGWRSGQRAPNSSMTKGRPSAAAMALRVDSHCAVEGDSWSPGSGMLLATLLSSDELAYT